MPHRLRHRPTRVAAALAGVLLLAACREEPPPRTDPTPGPPPPVGGQGGPAAPGPGSTGDLPIPADNPAWAWDAGGFVPSAAWYGEADWHDVRMRVVGHLGVATRDVARLRAQVGDLAGCAAAWDAWEARVAALPAPPPGGVAAQTRALWSSAAERDGALCAALARGEAPPVPTGAVAAPRARLLGLLLRHRDGASPDELAAEARRVQDLLLPALAPRADLDLDAFRHFDDRHRLRVALLAAALDSHDPLGMVDPWGYWEPAEAQRSALILGLVAGRLGGLDWSPRAPSLVVGAAAAAVAGLDGDPLTWPTRLAQALVLPGQVPDFTATGLGALPTGDALIDVAAQPGPRAIGRLERLGLEDPTHRAWLEAQAHALDAALQADPEQVPATVAALLAHLDAYGHGSRYYNLKQARNEAVRQLARAGQPALARQVLAGSWPLHGQDWACPNREGILRTIDARLLAAQGESEAALDRYAEALAAADAFLAAVAAAEAGRQVGRSPPGSGPGGGSSAGTPR